VARGVVDSSAPSQLKGVTIAPKPVPTRPADVDRWLDRAASDGPRSSAPCGGLASTRGRGMSASCGGSDQRPSLSEAGRIHDEITTVRLRFPLRHPGRARCRHGGIAYAKRTGRDPRTVSRSRRRHDRSRDRRICRRCVRISFCGPLGGDDDRNSYPYPPTDRQGCRPRRRAAANRPRPEKITDTTKE